MKTPLRILVVEDTPSDVDLMKREITKSGIEIELQAVDKKEDYLDALSSFSPDLILSDYTLPQFDGLKALKIRNELAPSLPFILVTGSVNEETAVECMKTGADDYVLKQNLTRLGQAILSALDKKDMIKSKMIAEEALRESERTKETLLDNLPGFIYRCANDHDWTMIYISEGCQRITGYSPDDFINNKTLAYNDIVHPDYQEPLWNKWQELLKKKEYFEEEYPIITASGETRWVWERGCGIFSEDDQLLFLEGFITDISDRKHAEEALKESEEKYRRIVEHLPDSVVVHARGKILYANTATFQMMGFDSFDQIKDIPVMDFVHPDYRDIAVQRIRKIYETGHASGLTEEKFITRNHEAIDVEVIGIPIHYMGQSAIQTISRDIRQRKRSELIQTILFNISNAVVTTKDIAELISIIREELGMILDTTNFYIAFYDPATGMLSTPYAQDEKDSIELWPAEKSLTGHVINIDHPLLVSKEDIVEMNRRGEINLVGTTAECWLGVPLHADDKVIGAFVVQSYNSRSAYSSKDVEMLEFISHQISLSVQRKKTEQELKIAMEKAQESDRLKSAFLANMSHEIRTPMNGILGFSELLDDETLSAEDRKKFISIISKSGNQLLTVINDIIDISKIDFNQMTFYKIQFNLNHLLNNLQISFENEKNRMGKADIQILIEKGLDDAKSYIETDEVRLTQVLNNLIGNALKFTQNGFIKFGYLVEAKKILFFVTDTGKGIAPEKQQIIFDRFRQEEESHVRTFGGSGLGLPISKGLIELLGGTIYLDSVLGKGSTFYFTLPGSFLVAPATDILQKPSPALPSDFKGKTILVAEDLVENFELMKRMLSKGHPTMLHAENGRKAVEIVKKDKAIDMILMDIRMPVMDGYEATREIRIFNPDIPIIALTAHAFPEDRTRCISAGCTDFISKPINREKLFSMVSRYLLQ